jgi:hypothetical protein
MWGTQLCVCLFVCVCLCVGSYESKRTKLIRHSIVAVDFSIPFDKTIIYLMIAATICFVSPGFGTFCGFFLLKKCHTFALLVLEFSITFLLNKY